MEKIIETFKFLWLLLFMFAITSSIIWGQDAQNQKLSRDEKFGQYTPVAIDPERIYGPLPGEKMKVFIFSGQSNMVGQGASQELDENLQKGNDRVLMFENGRWQPLRPLSRQFGPEIAFGDVMAKAWPEETIGIVKQAKGGTSILAWDPDWTKENADRAGDGHKGNLWKALTEKVHQAISSVNCDLVGFIWQQGGKDMHKVELGKEYAENLKKFVTALRWEFHVQHLPFILGSYRDTIWPDDIIGMKEEIKKVRPGAFWVLKAQQDAEAFLWPANMVPLRDLEQWPNDVHYNTRGQLELGTLFANGYLELLDQIMERSPEILPKEIPTHRKSVRKD